MISSVTVVFFFIFSNVFGINLEYEQTYHSGKYNVIPITVFPRIVSTETIFFGSWSVASIQGLKLFKGGNYLREETILY